MRRKVDKGRSAREFNKQASMTHRRNVQFSVRGGERL